VKETIEQPFAKYQYMSVSILAVYHYILQNVEVRHSFINVNFIPFDCLALCMRSIELAHVVSHAWERATPHSGVELKLRSIVTRLMQITVGEWELL